jgi:hypothetical protein
MENLEIKEDSVEDIFGHSGSSTNVLTTNKGDHQSINMNSFASGFGNTANDIQIIDNNNSERDSN